MAIEQKNEPSLRPFTDPVLSEEDIEVPDDYRMVPVRFRGSGGEYFRIWIVNLLLSIVTLGVYSAWAKVRSKRYFFGNTYIEDDAFEYHATPISILKGRAISVVILLLVYLSAYISGYLQAAFLGLIVLISPWVICNSLRFNSRYTSFRNVRFLFAGRVRRAYLILFGIPLIPVGIAGVVALGSWLENSSVGAETLSLTVTLGFVGAYLLFPLIQQRFTKFRINHQHYGQLALNTRVESGHYYFVYLKMILWSALAYGLLAGLVFVIALVVGKPLQNLANPGVAGSISPAFYLVSFLPLIVLGMWFRAYMECKIRNYVFDHSKVGTHVSLRSALKISRLMLIYLGNLVLLIVTLGLAYPWTKVRLQKYRLETIQLKVWGSLDHVVGQAESSRSSFGEELGEAFDVDLDLGF
ncbi:MAG: YjgN family protein [Pseudomonadota bacterium]